MQHQDVGRLELSVAALLGRNREVAARDDDGAIIPVVVEDRDAHPGCGGGHCHDAVAIDPGPVKVREESLAEIVATHRPDHHRPGALTRGRNGLVATLATAFGPPASARHGLAFPGAIRRVPS